MTRLQSQLYIRLQALQEQHMTQEERDTLNIWAHGDRVPGVKLGRLLSRLKKLADDDSTCQLLLATRQTPYTHAED